MRTIVCKSCGISVHTNGRATKYCAPCAKASLVRSIVTSWAKARQSKNDYVKKGKPRKCTFCGNEKLRDEWPRSPGGSMKKHCGCRTKPDACADCGVEIPYVQHSGVRLRCEPCAKRHKFALRYEARKKQRRARGLKHRPPSERLHDSHVKAYERLLKNKHDAHVKQWRSCDTRIYAWRYNYDPEFRAKELIRQQLVKARFKHSRLQERMRLSLKAGKTKAKWSEIVGYTPARLREHLESKFTRGMSWEAFMVGDIHIDHIVPRIKFDLSTLEGVRACWALSNLQPLWSHENARKHISDHCYTPNAYSIVQIGQ